MGFAWAEGVGGAWAYPVAGPVNIVAGPVNIVVGPVNIVAGPINTVAGR